MAPLRRRKPRRETARCPRLHSITRHTRDAMPGLHLAQGRLGPGLAEPELWPRRGTPAPRQADGPTQGTSLRGPGSRCDSRLRPDPARREVQPCHRHLNTYLQYRRSAAPEVFPCDPGAVQPKHQQVPLCWIYGDYDFPALLLLIPFPKFTLKGEALMNFLFDLRQGLTV